MKKISLTLTLCLAFLITLSGYAQVIPLKFNANGEFKIVQFTDIHFKYNNPASEAALSRIKEVLDAEHPDLVVFTGDLVYSAPADVAMRTVLDCASSRNIPFVVTFGNHDDEHGKTRAELYDVVRSVSYNIQPDRGAVDSPDYILPLKSSDGKKDAAVLYCLDSHSYSKLPDVKGYGWLTFDQVNWYRRQSADYTAKNGGKPLPALVFFHIPLPEYNEAASNENTILHGTRMEKACAPAVNTGMFTAMKEAGDVMGVFVGHDHDNDYSVMWNGIVLAYGRFTGGNTEYNHLLNGARVIVLKEGERTFSTWIRLKGGKIVNSTVFPDSYVKDDWRKRPLVTE
ncbi:metallophosphoesterase family protein [Bacteroides sp. UBA939]|uniref:metallophosphoesterase family protein n=1 Tax=Bacteroides sp. UBA939 TaxID=1946092 RepID=UPI0025C40E23|nr:metallophosphoesterase family protein [Bacteroides sp. UBA939]